jgi:bacterioferritin-associated ferredoxin
MPVTHCVCHNLSFEQLLDQARAAGLGFDQLRDATKCSTNCGMCEPYIRLMLQNGQTRFRPMSQITINRIMADAAEQSRCPNAATSAASNSSDSRSGSA